MDDVDIDAIMAGLEEDTTKDIQPISEIVTEIEIEANLEIEAAKTNVAEIIDLEDKNALSNRIVNTSLDIVENAKKVFENFSDDVFHGKDRSTSSKEAMLKALDVQNNANKNMIDLAKVLSNKDSGKGNNILIQNVSEKQAGISLNNIRNNLD